MPWTTVPPRPLPVRWLLPKAAWTAVPLIITVAYLALFAVAARSWRQRTGVALRFDVPPKRATVPLAIGMPMLLAGPAWMFRATGQARWLAAASVVFEVDSSLCVVDSPLCV